jgi:cation:H+ antiporter
MRMAFKFEKKRTPVAELLGEIDGGLPGMSLKKAIVRYALHAAVVVVAAVFLPSIAERIAAVTGLGQTFVGNIFVAVSTSFPELAVSFAAIRIGAVDMAVGNIFGSNIFNMLILAVEDIFFFKGPILSYAQPQHLIPSLLAMAMTGLAVAGLIYNAEKKLFVWAWDSFGIIVLFAVNLVLLYLLH